MTLRQRISRNLEPSLLSKSEKASNAFREQRNARHTQFRRAGRKSSNFSSLCLFLSLTIYLVSIVPSNQIHVDVCEGDSCLAPSDEQSMVRNRIIIGEAQPHEIARNANRKPLVHQIEVSSFKENRTALPSTDPDFGGISFSRSQINDQPLDTVVKDDDDGHVYTAEDYNDDFTLFSDQNTIEYFAFDDDGIRKSNCERVPWQTDAQPTCNLLHEISLVENVDEEGTGGRYLASGAYRDAFTVMNDEAVLKVSRFSRSYE